MKNASGSPTRPTLFRNRNGLYLRAFAALCALTTQVHAASASMLLAVAIPGTSLNVSTKTVFGWLLFCTFIYSAVRVIMAIQSSADERSKEERDEKIKGAWIVFGSVILIMAILHQMEFISFTDIQSAASSF